MRSDIFVFRRSMDEGKIGLLKLMEADHTERCKIHLYETFDLDLWLACIELCHIRQVFS